MIGVFVTPIPLIADSLDRELGRRDLAIRITRDRVLQIQQREREERDHDKDQNRNTGPDNLEQRVVAELGRYRVRFLVVANDDPAEQAHHKDGYRNDDPQQDIMEIVHLLHDRSNTGLETEGSIRRLSDERCCEGAGRGDRGER